MPRRATALALLIILSSAGARADDLALPDPCYDPERPWPVYCEPMSEASVARGDAVYQLYSFYEDLAGDQRPPPWVSERTVREIVRPCAKRS